MGLDVPKQLRYGPKRAPAEMTSAREKMGLGSKQKRNSAYYTSPSRTLQDVQMERLLGTTKRTAVAKPSGIPNDTEQGALGSMVRSKHPRAHDFR